MSAPHSDPSAAIDHGGGGDRAVQAAFLNVLYDNLLVSQLASLLVAVGLVAFFEGQTDPVNLKAWLGYMLVVGLLRIGSRVGYRRAEEPRDLVHWEHAFMIGVVLAGAGWGAAGLAFFDTSHVQQQILLTGAIAGISAGSISHLSPSPRAANAFLLLCLVPLAYSYLSDPTIGPGMGMLALLYLLTMMFVIRRTHRSMRQNILLIHSNQRLVDELTERTGLLQDAKTQDEAEREMALAVFRSILPHGALAADNLTYHLSSHSAFNGDLLLVETRPDGRQNLLLGDFTGHGLAASLGAIPVTDIFTVMTRKGFPLKVIASEINRKLHTHLPRNVFFAACLAEVDAGEGRVRIWNGGLPSVYLLHGSNGTIRERIDAMHPPLGILSPADFDDSVHILPIDNGDQVFMATDGVIEQGNAAGEMFGEQRLEDILNRVPDIAELADTLKAELARFGEGVGQGDDITFVALRATALAAAPPPQVVVEAGDLDNLTEPDWSMDVVLQPPTLRRVDPVPVLNHLVREMTGAGEEAAPFELVLGELYQNALDHGVLGLDSAQKRSAEGFADYYQQRELGLAELATGTISVELTNHPTTEGGVLEVRMTDSGKGFDHHALTTDAGEAAAHGRGIRLVSTFCRDLEYLGSGNRVRALFPWRRPG